MSASAYKKFQSSELTLRDKLALDRTVLANERTFLSYSRTGLGLIITGASLIEFFDLPLSRAFGLGGVVVGAITFIVGILRYLKVRSRYSELRIDETDETSEG